jgi:tetratricopeptide (TPR) repeat protein
MSSLSDLPEVVGFFSYSREDDDAFKGSLSALRDGIQRELSAQLGRTKRNFRLWQDQEGIAPGRLWESEIKTAVEQAVFFIPIVTPRAVNSENCQIEYGAFLERERKLDRTDLVFPILYIGVPALENEAQWRNHPVLSVVGKRQYVDWRQFRHQDIHTTAVREAIERFCGKIVEALNRPWLSPEERRQQEEAEAQERLEVLRRQQEAEAEQAAEEAARRSKDEAEAQRIAEERVQQQAEAERLALEEKDRIRAAEKAPLAEEETQKKKATREAAAPPDKEAASRAFAVIAVIIAVVAIASWFMAQSLSDNSATPDETCNKDTRNAYYAAAIPVCTQAIALKPKDEDSYRNRAFDYESLGKNAEAIADYKKVLTIDPSDQYAKDALKRLGASAASGGR